MTAVLLSAVIHGCTLSTDNKRGDDNPADEVKSIEVGNDIFYLEETKVYKEEIMGYWNMPEEGVNLRIKILSGNGGYEIVKITAPGKFPESRMTTSAEIVDGDIIAVTIKGPGKLADGEEKKWDYIYCRDVYEISDSKGETKRIGINSGVEEDSPPW